MVAEWTNIVPTSNSIVLSAVPVNSSNVPWTVGQSGGTAYLNAVELVQTAISAPTISSGSAQSFDVGDSPTSANDITITDSLSTPTITSANGIRIRIPSDLDMQWSNQADPSVSGSAVTDGKILSEPPVTYEDAGKTVVIPVLGDFSAGESITINALFFRSFTDASSDSLQLVVSGLDGATAATDNYTKIIIQTSVPGAPTITSAVAGNASATVTFTAPASNGGSAITGYTVSGGGTDSNAGSTSLTHTITGLTNGNSYTFTVTATNSIGTGSASAASGSVTPSSGCTATGGTITTYTDGGGTHEVHTFTSNGTFTLSGTCNAQVLLVAGGGSGAISHTSGSGGGGAGGVVYDSSHALTSQAYSVTVGTGGAARLVAAGSGAGNAGNNSVFDTLTAFGGGYGNYNTAPGGNGGSGGGGGGIQLGGTSTQTAQGSATVYGNPGCSAATGSGGGGGGAGGTCTAGTATPTGGNGGNGISNSITGSAVVYGCGGGGAPSGTGGTGGGGAGAPAGAGTAGSPGTSGLGGGGGAAYGTATSNSGPGGDGVVIISFVTSSSNPTISSASSQSFYVGEPSTAVQAITVTDTNPATITGANGICIQIPAGLHAVWDTSVSSITASGTATPSYVSTTPAVTYYNTNTTACIPVVDFTAGLNVTLSGLKLMTFASASSGNLGLIISGSGGSVISSDDKTTSISADTVPGAPNIGTAIAGNAQASVLFTAPSSNGGATIDGYTVTSSPAGGTDINAGQTGLMHTITGLTNSTVYTFSVTAHNSVGTGAASANSNAVTPLPITAPSHIVIVMDENHAENERL